MSAPFLDSEDPECLCEWDDVLGLGWPPMKVTEHPDCPVCAPYDSSEDVQEPSGCPCGARSVVCPTEESCHER